MADTEQLRPALAMVDADAEHFIETMSEADFRRCERTLFGADVAQAASSFASSSHSILENALHAQMCRVTAAATASPTGRSGVRCHQHNFLSNSVNKCHMCGESETDGVPPLKACPTCGVAAYCNRVCQVRAMTGSVGGLKAGGAPTLINIELVRHGFGLACHATLAGTVARLVRVFDVATSVGAALDGVVRTYREWTAVREFDLRLAEYCTVGSTVGASSEHVYALLGAAIELARKYVQENGFTRYLATTPWASAAGFFACTTPFALTHAAQQEKLCLVLRGATSLDVGACARTPHAATERVWLWSSREVLNTHVATLPTLFEMWRAEQSAGTGSVAYFVTFSNQLDTLLAEARVNGAVEKPPALVGVPLVSHSLVVCYSHRSRQGFIAQALCGRYTLREWLDFAEPLPRVPGADVVVEPPPQSSDKRRGRGGRGARRRRATKREEQTTAGPAFRGILDDAQMDNVFKWLDRLLFPATRDKRSARLLGTRFFDLFGARAFGFGVGAFGSVLMSGEGSQLRTAPHTEPMRAGVVRNSALSFDALGSVLASVEARQE